MHTVEEAVELGPGLLGLVHQQLADDPNNLGRLLGDIGQVLFNLILVTLTTWEWSARYAH
jgi:hypothetical protein